MMDPIINQPWKTRIKHKDLVDYDLCGYTYTTTGHTDGGGLVGWEYMLDAIKLMCPNKRWRRAMDFGAGDGVLGMALIANDIVDEVVFVERYQPAIDNCELNLKQNNLYGHSVVKCDGVEHLDAGLFDFIISNPPARRTITLQQLQKDEWISTTKGVTNYKEKLQEYNSFRPHRMFDWDWAVHKTFYSNIHKHLQPGADLFILESGSGSNPLYWEWGDPVGLEIVEWVDGNAIPAMDVDYLLHLIASNPTNK